MTHKKNEDSELVLYTPEGEVPITAHGIVALINEANRLQVAERLKAKMNHNKQAYQNSTFLRSKRGKK